ncbi:MAG: hypothetical protein GWN31_08795 [Candidatus Thorarchaeota archaeon]|nr:hypothetical protein [Candidatus Thorarchaeota archaeon]NIW14014.1 hypothetical protein [Candidatus Thorarchaeota archaeon]
MKLDGTESGEVLSVRVAGRSHLLLHLVGKKPDGSDIDELVLTRIIDVRDNTLSETKKEEEE